MAERPWWLRWDGVPPKWVERQREVLSPRRVLWTRILYVAFPLGAVVFAVFTGDWSFPLSMCFIYAFSFWAMAPHQRRQVLGLPARQGTDPS